MIPLRTTFDQRGWPADVQNEWWPQGPEWAGWWPPFDGPSWTASRLRGAR